MHHASVRLSSQTISGEREGGILLSLRRSPLCGADLDLARPAKRR